MSPGRVGGHSGIANESEHMDYTVIARRWRPKTFDDVVGQPHIMMTMKNSMKSRRIAHAYLFTGPRGVGKTSVARILAKAVNCVQGPTPEPCNVCDNCLGIYSGSFVDVVEIDAASTTGIDNIRELRETVRYMPMKGRYKVYILDEAHQLSGAAKDAFLKTLEEPPAHAIFVLATTEPQKIPYTIVSRCQRFDFRRIGEAEIVSQLQKICDAEGVSYEKGAFDQIAIEADGSMRDGESLLDQVIAYSGRHIAEADVLNIIGLVEKEVLYEIVATLFAGDLKGGLEAIERTLNRGYDAHQIHKGLVSTLRNMMVLKVCEGIPDFLYMTEKEYHRNRDLLENVEYYEVQNMLHYLLNAEDLLRGLFPKVALEVLYINLYNISRLRSVDKLIETAERSETSRGESLPEARRYEVPEDRPAEGSYSPPGVHDAGGFIQFLKSRQPVVGSVLEALECGLENGSFVVSLDRMHNYLKDDAEMKEEIKVHLKEYLGTETGLIFREGSEQKRNVLDEYVREAETLFKV